MIEVSANIGGVSTCVLVVLFPSVSPSPFYRLKEEGLHAWGISEVVYFFPLGPGENSGSSLSPSAVEHGVSRGHRPRESFRPCPECVLVL